MKKFTDWLLARENTLNASNFIKKPSAKDDFKKIDTEIKKVLAGTVGQPANIRKKKLQNVANMAASREDLGPKSVERIAQIASEIK